MQCSVCSLVLASTLVITPAGAVLAQSTSSAGPTGTAGTTTTSDAMSDVRQDLQEATNVAKKMAQQADVKSLLERSKGVFLIPDYGRGAFVVGGSGGEGVLLPRMNGRWGNPAFYNIGALSVGAQAGVTAGQVAMILMTDRALNSFKGQNTFSLDAKAGLTIANWSARSKASLGTADIVLWSDTEGLFGGASVGASTISADTEQNEALYNQKNVAPGAILSGSATTNNSEAMALKQSL